MDYKKSIYIICTVRGASDDYKKKLEEYTERLEKLNYDVYLPHRDTDQTLNQYDLCMMNFKAITDADEIHIFYNSKSTGTHFDLGMSFAMGKKMVVVENEEDEKNSFSKLLNEWINKQDKI